MKRISFLTLFFFLNTPLIVHSDSSNSQCFGKKHEAILEKTLKLAMRGFEQNGYELPYIDVVVNPTQLMPDSTLVVEVLSDDSFQKQCTHQKVEGVCTVKPGYSNLIQCSSGAIEVLSNKEGITPALLYVMAHEMAHLYQKYNGAFTPQLATIDLALDSKEKFAVLEQGCEKRLYKSKVAQEEEADDIALSVMQTLFQKSPFVETAFSPKGSMYWNLDQIRVIANKLQKWSSLQSMLPVVSVHPVFDPNTEISLPATTQYVNWAARRFICDVTTKTNGILTYPLRQRTHPSAEMRMKKVANRLELIADTLEGTSKNYNRSSSIAAISNLQEDVSPVFSYFDQEYGVYFDKLHSSTCSSINLGLGSLDCSKVELEPPTKVFSCDRFEGNFVHEKLFSSVSKVKTSKFGDLMKVTGSVHTALPLSDGTLLVGLVEPKEILHINNQQNANKSYPIDCTPVSAISSPAGATFLCENSFGLITVGKETASYMRFYKGSWGGEQGDLNARTIKPLWLGYHGKYVASIRLPSGDGISISLRGDKSTSLDAWYRDSRCGDLTSAMGLWQFNNDGYLYGATIDPDGAMITAQFDSELMHIHSFSDLDDVDFPDDVDFDTWEQPAPLLNCGPGYQQEKTLCINAEGQLYSITEKGNKKSIATIALPEDLHTINVCSTNITVYGLTTTKEGFGETSFFKVASDGRRKVIFKESVTNGGSLVCQPNGALAIVRMWGESVIIQKP